MTTKRGFKPINTQNLVIVGVLLFILLVLTFISPGFLSARNLLNVLQQNVSVIIAGCAVTMLMVSGYFDLSIGSVMALAGTMSAIFVSAFSLPLPVSILLSLLLGGSIGLLNGFLVVIMNVPCALIRKWRTCS